MAETNKLTIKQRKWLEIYLETGNATAAARRAYNCNERSARQIGYENMTKLDFTDVLEAQGATAAMLVKLIVEGAKATKLIKTKEVPDWEIRHKYLITILRLKQMFPQPETTRNNEEEPIRIVFQDPFQDTNPNQKVIDTNSPNLIV